VGGASCQRVVRRSRPLGRILPFACLADGDTFSFQVLAEAVVELGKAAQLQVCHALLVLLDLGWVADITGSVLRHGGRVR